MPYALKEKYSLPMYSFTKNANSIPTKKHGSMQKADQIKGNNMEMNLNVM